MNLGLSGRLTRATIGSPLTPLFLIVSIAVGLMALLVIPREEEPQISVPMVDIRINADGLKAADAGYTPERALEQLQRIQHHRVRLNGGEPVAGVSTLSTEQNEVLHALGIEKPAAPEQLALL